MATQVPWTPVVVRNAPGFPSVSVNGPTRVKDINDTGKGASDSAMEADCSGDAATDDTLKMEPFRETQLPGSTTCLACSADGRFLSLGHSQGFSVWCASSLDCVSQWLRDTVEITAIQFSTLTDTAHLLCTIDDMGVARVFGLYSESIYLLSVINAMEDVNKRSICLAFDASEGGDYGAASLSCGGSVWMEVYRFPRDAWLREMRMAQSQTELPESEVNFTAVAPIITTKPTRGPAVGTADGPADTLQMRDFLIHFLAVDKNVSHTEHREPTADIDAENAAETNGSSECCTLHFLLPRPQFPDNCKAKPKTGLPAAVCVWWSGSRNLSQYFLQKASKNKPGVEPVPDVLWPHEKEIACSAVSGCARYIAVGLEGGLVSVWDRKLDCPLSSILATAADSALLRMHFVNQQAVSADDDQTPRTAELRLLILCKSGAILTATTGRGMQPSATMLMERPQDIAAVPTVTVSLPFLQGLLLVVQRNGKMLLQDVLSGTVVCYLALPSTHLMATHCNPVLAFNAKDRTLFIKGDNYPSASVSPQEEEKESEDIEENSIEERSVHEHSVHEHSVDEHSGEEQSLKEHSVEGHLREEHLIEEDLSGLFIFSLGECDATQCYITATQREAPGPATLQESCDHYLQQRARSVDERNKALQQSWRRLEETSAMLQLRQRGTAAT